MTTQKTTIASRASRKKGFTLTEIAIVLGIIGLILGAIWVAAASVYSNQRTAHANTAILQIAQGVRTLYSSASNMGTASSDITSALVTSNVVPADIASTGPFPNGVTKVYTDTDTPPIGFTIVMSSVPQSSCIALLSQVGGTTRDAGLFYASATNTATPSTSNAQNTTVPMATAVTPATAATSCSNANNNVIFGFSLR